MSQNFYQTWQVQKIAEISEAQVKTKTSQGKDKIDALFKIESLKSQLKVLNLLSLNYNYEL